ncbi:hypothetical protein Tco_1154531 [Tanacetum coccineum]
MDLFNLISAPNLAKVKTGTCPRAAHEVPLLTVTANRVIDMREPAAATESSGTPTTIERSPLDFSDENPSQPINEGDETEDQVLETRASEVPPTGHASTTGVAPNIVIEEEDAADVPLVSKRRRKRVNDGANANAQPKGNPAGTIDPDPLSFAEPQPASAQDIAESSKGEILRSLPPLHPLLGRQADVVDHMVPSGYFSKLHHLPNEEFLNQYNVNLALQVAMGSQLRLRFEQLVRLLMTAKEKVAKRDQRIHVREEEIKKLDQEVQGLRNQTRNLETPLEAEVDMKKAVKANSAELTRELESLRAKFLDLQVNNKQLFQQVSTLQAQVTGEEQIKAAFEEFKKREDDKVERRCAKIDARLDALSVDFDEELYPHMLTTIAGRQWVIGHGLCLAVMKCAESTDLRQAFANVVSTGIAKGMSEGLKHGVEHEKAQLDLEVIEAYNPEADAKYVAALHALKDLEYPLIDHPEKLKDAPIDLIMASLHLESDVGEETPQWICELRPSSSQLNIPVYPEGLAILLTNASTRTETTEDEASPRLIRSKSLPPMYNLDWP